MSTGCSFAAVVNKLEEFDEVVKAGKIVNVSTLKMQLKALQGQSSSGKKAQFKKKKEENAFVWDQGPRLDPDFRTGTRTHPSTLITQTPVLFITLLSTILAPDPTTQTYLYHLSIFLNQVCKLDLDFLLIQDLFCQTTKPIVILKPMKFKIKSNTIPLSIWADLSTNYTSNLRLLVKLAWCFLKPTLGAFPLVTILKPFVHITLKVLDTLLTSVGH